MKTHINKHQIVMHEGVPVAAVLPYGEYLALLEGKTGDFEDILSDEEIEAALNDEYTIPNEVVGFIVKKRFTPIRAWREYLGLTQAEVAKRMNTSQSSYARMERGQADVRIATLKNIAKAMGIHYSQLDLGSEE